MRAIAGSALALALALAGCGGGGGSSSTASGNNPVPVKLNGKSSTIDLSSPAVKNRGTLPSAYTCDGKNTWPSLSWSSVPSGTRELVLFVIQLGQGEQGNSSVRWAVAGLTPGEHGIKAGKLPHGAIVGRGTNGKSRYSLCPPKGASTRIAFVLLAAEKRLKVKRGFEGAPLLNTLGSSSPPFGGIIASYARS